MSGEAGAEGVEAGGGLLLNQPVVIDNGSSAIKAGFAGGSKPKVCFGEHVCIFVRFLFVQRRIWNFHSHLESHAFL